MIRAEISMQQSIVFQPDAFGCKEFVDQPSHVFVFGGTQLRCKVLRRAFLHISVPGLIVRAFDSTALRQRWIHLVNATEEASHLTGASILPGFVERLKNVSCEHLPGNQRMYRDRMRLNRKLVT